LRRAAIAQEQKNHGVRGERFAGGIGSRKAVLRTYFGKEREKHWTGQESVARIKPPETGTAVPEDRHAPKGKTKKNATTSGGKKTYKI